VHLLAQKSIQMGTNRDFAFFHVFRQLVCEYLAIYEVLKIIQINRVKFDNVVREYASNGWLLEQKKKLISIAFRMTLRND